MPVDVGRNVVTSGRPRARVAVMHRFVICRHEEEGRNVTREVGLSAVLRMDLDDQRLGNYRLFDADTSSFP